MLRESVNLGSFRNVRAMMGDGHNAQGVHAGCLPVDSRKLLLGGDILHGK